MLWQKRLGGHAQLLCLPCCRAWRRSSRRLSDGAYADAQVKRKMTAEEFVHNNRGINAGASLPPDFLRALYSSIVARPIRMPASGCLAHVREERNGGPGAPFAMPRLLSRCGALSCPLQTCPPLLPVPTSLHRRSGHACARLGSSGACACEGRCPVGL